jgi:hypothetical protein
MPSKKPAIISAIATFILLLIVGVLFFFVQIVALNGVMNENQAFTSLGIGLVCQGITMLLAAGFAAWFSNLLILRFDWHKTWAVVMAVLLGTMIGTALSLIATAAAIPLAGIR